MKEIKIAEQPWLSLHRTIRITVDGIRYRLFRASVTVAVIVVAVAFLMNILSESLIKRSVAANTRERIQNARLIYAWSARLTSPGSLESLVADLSGNRPDAPVSREIQGFGRFTDREMAELRRQAARISSVLAFFNGLDYAKRRAMIHTATGMGILSRLQDPAGMDQFRTALARIRSVHFVLSEEELAALLEASPRVRGQLNQVLAARSRAIAAVNQAVKDGELLACLAQADHHFGDVIRQAGFVFDQDTLAPTIASQAQRLIDTLHLEKSMEERPCRQLIAQQANILPADVNVMMMWEYLDSRRFAARYLERMSTAGLSVTGLDADRLVDLARGRKENAALIKAERLTVDAGRGFMGLGERLAWLLFVSMLVCGIGITNAMMMSVTERFNEIATLKCLGALDGFIMVMFVLESCFMGIVGGAIGAVLGGVIGLGRMLAAFGVNFFSAVPVGDIMLGMVIAIVLGTLLAAVAAVLPSFKAARLAPMEAMRVE
ncbi:MAG: FtsX-like permease family protein [Lentisphaeria bacterium]|jgi:putative ABC transport system permease protein|nr:FtsX-like permease family protein [Lentisphaeria bacterium]